MRVYPNKKKNPSFIQNAKVLKVGGDYLFSTMIRTYHNRLDCFEMQ